VSTAICIASLLFFVIISVYLFIEVVKTLCTERKRGEKEEEEFLRKEEEKERGEIG